MENQSLWASKTSILTLIVLMSFVLSQSVIYASDKYLVSTNMELVTTVNQEENNLLPKTSYCNNSDDTISVFSSTGEAIPLSKADIDLMAKVVYGESRGEPYDGQVAVASVILNRVKSGKYEPSVTAVVKQKNAFSCVQDGVIDVTPTEACYKAVYEALNGNDPTSNALFFYNPTISTCSWMDNVHKLNSTNIGNHVFFSI